MIIISESANRGYPSVLDRCNKCEEKVEDDEDEDEDTSVCGSDGRTYSSECQLEWIACKRNWNISLVSQGSCEEKCSGLKLGNDLYTDIDIFSIKVNPIWDIFSLFRWFLSNRTLQSL